MPKTMLAMPIRINAGRHPGANNELTIGCPFGVEGRTVTDSSSNEMAPACWQSSSKVMAAAAGKRTLRGSPAFGQADEKPSVKSAAELFVSADPPDDRGTKPRCHS